MKTINKATIVVELVDTETGEVTNEEKDITSLLSGVSISKEKKKKSNTNNAKTGKLDTF